ncbi:MAG: DNA cytosine methyltransferase [Adlercreutzia equolifaciens]
MKVLELFSGTRSIGEAFEKRGHEVFSVEWDESLPADLHADIEFLKAPDVLRAFGRPDVVWASPDCATFSMAGISRHRRKNANTGNLDPVSDYALKCDRVDLAMLRLIRDLRPALYFIENPRAGLRKQDMMAVIPRHTVTYLPIRREGHEADRHIHERLRPAILPAVPQRGALPRVGAARVEVRHAGPGGRARARAHPESCACRIVDVCEREVPIRKAAGLCR